MLDARSAHVDGKRRARHVAGHEIERLHHRAGEPGRSHLAEHVDRRGDLFHPTESRLLALSQDQLVDREHPLARIVDVERDREAGGHELVPAPLPRWS
jgi:hypothetical protein